MENHRQPPWHSITAAEVMARLGTSANGLSDAEAAKRLKENGRNEINQKPSRSLGRMIQRQILDPMPLILLAASAFSAFFRGWTEATVILGIVILNAVLGVWEETKAQSVLEALKKRRAPTARVTRQGRECVIPSAELVAGDVVLLESGSMVPADLRLFETVNLKIAETSYPGKSTVIEKNAEVELGEECQMRNRTNMAYAASVVTQGYGAGIVAEAGMETEVARAVDVWNEKEDFDTPMKRKLEAAGRTLSILGAIVCMFIFAIGGMYGRPLIPQILTALALAVSIIPEGLPATATIVMARGVQRMAKKNAMVRKLSAVELLGNVTVICCDKTGIMTWNQMKVTHMAVWDDFGKGTYRTLEEARREHPESCRELAGVSVLCSSAGLYRGKKGKLPDDPAENALLQTAKEFGIDCRDWYKRYPRVYEAPFAENRKRNSAVHWMVRQYILFTKGPVEEILPLCSTIQTSSGKRAMTEEDRENISRVGENMSGHSLRVLGFAAREIAELPKEHENPECELTFVGIMGMMDPPRREVRESVRVCREAGIRTVMISGDEKSAAVAIAKELDIYKPGDAAVSGEEMKRLPDEALDEKVKTVSVFARISPADKLRILCSLKRNEEVVAMTGNGVMEAPALRAADIGVAMGTAGTDVTKEASGLILLDDSFATLVKAMKEGRLVYRNIQKVLQFLLAGNISEITVLFLATLCNWDAPLQAVQILWINLATATLPALALGMDPPSQNIMKHKPVREGTLFEKDFILRVLTQGIFTAATALFAYRTGSDTGGLLVGQTMAFWVLALSQLLRALNQRSNTEPVWVRMKARNPWLLESIFVSVALILCIYFIPALRDAFCLALLNTQQWGKTLGLALLSLVQMELVKIFKRKKRRKYRE